MAEIIHTGKIREKITERGYYVSPLGLIMNDCSDNYAMGDIRYSHGLRRILGKEEVIISAESIEGKLKLVWMLQDEKIPFRKTKIKN
jgi:hypothetical protein